MKELSLFARLLRRLRRERGLTQAMLAQQVSCALDTIKKLETDARHPSRQLATRLSDLFELGGAERAEFLAVVHNVGKQSAAPSAARDTPKYGAAALPSAARRSLPLQFTSFIGRQQELDALTSLLADPLCRLITVTGPGGIGKTRLAVEVASRLLTPDGSPLPIFADGVWFVTLVAVDSPEHIVLTIAEALQCPPPGNADVRDHLLAYLQARDLLLVLDNFEHLQRWPDLLIAILTAAPQVKLLVTSREALNLEQEWRYPLNGLPLDSVNGAGEGTQADAVSLFVERARRVSPAFDPSAEGDAIGRICLLVEGFPLAIELAATWTRVLSCTAIANEIVGNLAFLTSDLRNLPDRHRSMQAIFARSLDLLSQQERQVFARLSVFRAGFRREAAEEVAGATLPVLTALLDKSLLRREAEGRYRLHELVRQYAAACLDQSDAGAANAHDQHCAYYTEFLAQKAADLYGGRQAQALAEIAPELENIRAAWQHASQHRRIADIQRAAYPLYIFYDYNSRYQEGFQLFEETAQRLDQWRGESSRLNRSRTHVVGTSPLSGLAFDPAGRSNTRVVSCLSAAKPFSPSWQSHRGPMRAPIHWWRWVRWPMQLVTMRRQPGWGRQRASVVKRMMTLATSCMPVMCSPMRLLRAGAMQRQAATANARVSSPNS